MFGCVGQATILGSAFAEVEGRAFAVARQRQPSVSATRRRAPSRHDPPYLASRGVVLLPEFAVDRPPVDVEQFDGPERAPGLRCRVLHLPWPRDHALWPVSDGQEPKDTEEPGRSCWIVGLLPTSRTD